MGSEPQKTRSQNVNALSADILHTGCNSIRNIMLRALQVAAITLTGDAVQI